jgi:hypothetical protein
MGKLLLLSIIIGAIAIPVRAAKVKDPRRGLKKALTQAAVFNLMYLVFLLYIYGRL